MLMGAYYLLFNPFAQFTEWSLYLVLDKLGTFHPLKDLEVMHMNVINSAFDGVSTVEACVEVGIG